VNSYATVPALKARLNITGTSEDAYLLTVVEAASRVADQLSERHFYTETATKHFDGTDRAELVIPDLLSATTVKTDPDRDETYDYAWTTEYVLEPQHRNPKTAIRKKLNDSSEFSIHGGRKWLQITGVWGAGNLKDADPWYAQGETGTVGTLAGTTLTTSTGALLEAGQTIRLVSEQMYVTAVDGVSATVERAVNGTTAAAHTTNAIELADYPPDVVRGTLALAVQMYNEVKRLGLQSESIGDYSYSLANQAHQDAVMMRLFNNVRREAWF